MLMLCKVTSFKLRKHCEELLKLIKLNIQYCHDLMIVYVKLTIESEIL